MGGQAGGGKLVGGRGDQFAEGVHLARSERPPRRPLPCREHLGGGTAVVGQVDPPFVARSGPGTEEHPFEADLPIRLEGAEAAEETGPAVGSREVADGSRPGLELGEEVRDGRVDRRDTPVVRGTRRQLGHQLESLEQPGWQHRAKDQGGRCEIPVGDPARQPEAERRQERPVGAHAIDDRLGRRYRESGRICKHDPECLPPAELDQHRLAELEVAEPVRDQVGVRPVPARGIDRHFDGPAGIGPCAVIPRRARLRHWRLVPERLGKGHGDRG